jgi:hypothetical protein
MPRVDAEYPYSRNSVPGPRAPRPKVIFDFYTKILPGTDSFEWNVHGEIDNGSDGGEPCASYWRANKRANGNTFVTCFEGHDFDERALPPDVARARLIPVEIDLMGARGRVTEGEGIRCVIGRSSDSPLRDPNDHGVSHLQAFFRLVRYVPDWGYALVDSFLRAEIKTEYGIVSMQSGDCVRFSDDPAIPVACFEPATGILGLWIREQKLCVIGINCTPPFPTYFNRAFPQATF